MIPFDVLEAEEMFVMYRPDRAMLHLEFPLLSSDHSELSTLFVYKFKTVSQQTSSSKKINETGYSQINKLSTVKRLMTEKHFRFLSRNIKRL